MKLLRRNKFTVICIAICTIVFILAIGVFKLLFPDAGTPVYGNRLDEIKDLEITESTLKKHNKSIEDESVKEITSHVTGKIISVTIVTKEKTDIKKAKEIADKYIALFSEDELKHYEFSLFLINEVEDATGYPLIGQKSSASESIVYNKE